MYPRSQEYQEPAYFEQLSVGQVDATNADFRCRTCFVCWQQVNHLSVNDTESASRAEDYEEFKYSRQLRETHVIVRLVDCMQCYVKVPRFRIKEDDDSDPTTTSVSLTQQVTGQQEGKLEETKEVVIERQQSDHSIRDISQTTKADDGDDEELYFRAIEFEDCNMMETYIYIDLPWPQASD